MEKSTQKFYYKVALGRVINGAFKEDITFYVVHNTDSLALSRLAIISLTKYLCRKAQLDNRIYPIEFCSSVVGGVDITRDCLEDIGLNLNIDPRDLSANVRMTDFHNNHIIAKDVFEDCHLNITVGEYSRRTFKIQDFIKAPVKIYI